MEGRVRPRELVFSFGRWIDVCILSEDESVPAHDRLIWIAVNAGLSAPFHPSTLGILITVGSCVGIVVLGRWMTGRPPQK